jgi:hypothetical protein
VRSRESDGVSIATCQELGIKSAILTVNRTDGVNHVLRGQLAGGCYYRLAGWQTSGMHFTSDLATFGQDGWPATPMYRSVNATAAEQSDVRGVDDRIDTFLGEVTDFDDHAAIQKFPHERILGQSSRFFKMTGGHEAIVHRNHASEYGTEGYKAERHVEIIGKVAQPNPPP